MSSNKSSEYDIKEFLSNSLNNFQSEKILENIINKSLQQGKWIDVKSEMKLSDIENDNIHDDNIHEYSRAVRFLVDKELINYYKERNDDGVFNYFLTPIPENIYSFFKENI